MIQPDAKLIVFDLDGTLVDSEPAYSHVLSEILEPYDVGPFEEVLESIRSQSPGTLFDGLLGRQEGQKALKKLQAMDRVLWSNIPLFSGIEDLLEGLLSRDTALALWTARDRESAQNLICNLSLEKFFPYWLSGSCVPKNKPAPDGLAQVLKHYSCLPEEAYMVGDHNHDMEAAHALGSQAVLARWKPKPMQPLKSCVDFSAPKDFYDWICKSLSLPPNPAPSS